MTTTKVVMIVDTVSPTPFALLRRAKNFDYQEDHWHLQKFASYEDPIRALTDECLRVLKCISSTNESSVSTSKHSTSLRDASWSRFEDIGFGGSIESDHEDEEKQAPATRSESAGGMKTAPQSQSGDLGRPTTPSWADFMSSGFSDEANLKDPVGPLLLPPDKVLPPITASRGQSSHSHKRMLDDEPSLEPAELASISSLDLDDSFWWVWITSLSGDEPLSRKAVFGRCALLETVIRGTKWLVLEEQVKGAAPEPEAGAQIVEKKRFFSFGKKNATKLSRRKSSAKKVSSIQESYKRPNNPAPQSKTSIGPDQHKRIQAAAAALQRKHREQEAEAKEARASNAAGDSASRTNSALTLQPAIVNEASSAMKWASNYDKNAFRAAYLSDSRAGTGAHTDGTNGTDAAEKPMTPAPLPPSTTKSGLPPPPKDTAIATPLPPSPEPAKKKPATEAVPEESKITTKPVVVEQPIETLPMPPAEEVGKKSKKTGLKGMFTPNKKKGEQPALKGTGAPNSSSVAAARAALEAKAKEAQESISRSPPSNATLKKKAVPQKPPASETSAPVTVAAVETEMPSTPQQPEPVLEHEAVVGTPESHGPPQTRRGVEYDALSRVDTNERDAADQEFSKFDHGPLLEQPAFVPEDEPATPQAEPEQPRTPTNGHEEKPEDVQAGMTPEQDRWAQIRKNAAERAVVPGPTEVAEEPETRTSHSERTDEGDTSGEESKS